MTTIIKLLLILTISFISFLNDKLNIIFIFLVIFLVIIKKFNAKEYFKGLCYILFYSLFFLMYEIISVFIFKKEFSLYFVPIILRIAVSYSAVFLFYKTTPSYVISEDLKFQGFVLTLMFIPEIFNIYKNVLLTYKNRYKKKNVFVFLKTVLPLVIIISMIKAKEKYYSLSSKQKLNNIN